MTETQLPCTLIEVSNLAYKIRYGLPAREQPQDVKMAIGKIGLLPETLKSFEIGKDACAFAETDAEAILFFRGTLPPWLILQDKSLVLKVVKDWLDDANILLVSGQTLPGLVHSGFLNSLDALWASVRAFTAGTGKPLYVTGHSKGGALAFLASYRLSKIGRKPSAVRTFGAPRVGDRAFAAAYDFELPQTYRVEYRDDLVPHLPPSAGAWLKILEGRQLIHGQFPAEASHIQVDLQSAKDIDDIVARLKDLLNLGLDYTSAGALEFLDWSTPPRTLPESSGLAWKRALSLAEKVAEFRVDEIVEDHLSDLGYLTSACPSDAAPPAA